MSCNGNCGCLGDGFAAVVGGIYLNDTIAAVDIVH